MNLARLRRRNGLPGQGWAARRAMIELGASLAGAPASRLPRAARASGADVSGHPRRDRATTWSGPGPEQPFGELGLAARREVVSF